jgi:hypothetical protein
VSYFNEDKSFIIEGQFSNDSLIGFGRVAFKDQVHSVGFHRDYYLHGFGKKLQIDGKTLQGYFQYDILYDKDDVSTYDPLNDGIARTIEWDNYLTHMDEDELDEAEE